MAGVSVSSFDIRNVKSVLLFLCILFGGCNHVVKLTASGLPAIGTLSGAPNILGTILSSLNMSRVSAGQMVASVAGYCPAGAQNGCVLLTDAVKIVFGLNP